MIAPLGSVYTPQALALCVAERALARWPADRALRVCDPACGDGALLAAVQTLRPDAALVGMDVDAMALKAARQRLGTSVDLRCGDALTADWSGDEFDIVVANPPWVSFSGRHAQPIGAERRALLRANYPLFRSWPALHSAFVELCAGLARERVAWLLPSRVCDGERYGPVRSFLRAQGCVVDPTMFLGESAFEDVVMPGCLLVWERSGVSSTRGSEPFAMSEGAASALDGWPKPPKQMFADMGVHTGNCARKVIGSVGVPVREGKDLRAFSLADARIRYRADYAADLGEYFRAGSLESYRAIPIVLRQTADRAIAALHREPTYFRNSVLACRGLPGVDPALVVAWLNSSLVAEYHQSNVRESGQRTFPQLKIRHLRDLPLPPLATAPSELVELARAVAVDGQLDRAAELDRVFCDWAFRS